MIIELKEHVDQASIDRIARQLTAVSLVYQGKKLLVTGSAVKNLPDDLRAFTERVFVFENDMQLASRNFLSETRSISIGDFIFGGTTNKTIIITGPCSVESEEQIEQSAQLCIESGVNILRGGCYKPRTSPYSFQGLGLEGLKLLDKMRTKYGLYIITEVRDASHVDDVIDYADIVQIGAKAMYDHGILRKCGKANKPVLLKRGFGSTLQEFVQAAEFVLSGGNDQVILCERGIRTFETKTRFTLDLCGVSYLKEFTNLPIVVDPSHALGYRYGIADLSRAAVAMGVEGLLIESHPDPAVAKSDAAQQLDHSAFRELYGSLNAVAKAINKEIS